MAGWGPEPPSWVRTDVRTASSSGLSSLPGRIEDLQWQMRVAKRTSHTKSVLGVPYSFTEFSGEGRRMLLSAHEAKIVSLVRNKPDT